MIDRSFKLRADTIRVHDRAAINGDVNPRDGDIALLVDRGLDDRCDIAHETAMGRKPRPCPFGTSRLPQPAFSVTSSTTLRSRPVSIG